MADKLHTSAHPVVAPPGSSRSRRFFSGPAPWLIPSILVLLIVSLYPLIFAVFNSFRFYNLGVSVEPGGFVGFANYARALGDPDFLGAIVNTLTFCIVVTAVEMVLGVALALLLRERLVGVGVARAILIMPVAIAPAIAGLTFRSMYTSGTGLVPAVMEKLGIHVPEAGILGDPASAMPALMITDIWQWTPFVALIALAALQGVPQDVVEAARVDGAGGFRILSSITLPMIGTALATVALLRFIQSFNVFDIIYVQTRGGPGGSTTTVGFEIFMAGLNSYNIGFASALTMLASIIVGVFINVYFVVSNRKGRTRNV
ncbi:sugar ABC transporter permease [Leucobacter sp. CSA1]|uniref:Sugar ABC transporter permease n=1 Tax=Leucobacter chromiisoli TaxID=2796471 RepID=A0A934UUP8_9MICO|nr:sugar ABC transporter permease [Leucobacter chromiisoli]MBK0418656.1 sugar ABC transporter permease [Leucobacter chromiisoli]